MTRLEGAELCFLRSVKGYTRLDKIRSEIIINELEISETQEVSIKHKQNWTNHLQRMDNTRLPKHAFNYHPRGRRDRRCPKNDGNASMPEQVKVDDDDDDDDFYEGYFALTFNVIYFRITLIL
jgi:hypothetical protein